MNKTFLYALATLFGLFAFSLHAGAVPQVGQELQPDVATTHFDQLVKNTINWILTFLGFIAVIVIIVAGIRTVVASNDENEAKKALSTLKWAIIGLVVVIASYAIVNFILGFFTMQ
jgi:hypothetical protein